MTEIDYAQLYTIVLSIALSSTGFAAAWGRAKNTFHQFRNLVDDVDTAVQDPAVTEAEFQKIWNDFKGFIHVTTKSGVPK